MARLLTTIKTKTGIKTVDMEATLKFRENPEYAIIANDGKKGEGFVFTDKSCGSYDTKYIQTKVVSDNTNIKSYFILDSNVKNIDDALKSIIASKKFNTIECGTVAFDKTWFCPRAIYGDMVCRSLGDEFKTPKKLVKGGKVILTSDNRAIVAAGLTADEVVESLLLAFNSNSNNRKPNK